MTITDHVLITRVKRFDGSNSIVKSSEKQLMNNAWWAIHGCGQGVRKSKVQKKLTVAAVKLLGSIQETKKRLAVGNSSLSPGSLPHLRCYVGLWQSKFHGNGCRFPPPLFCLPCNEAGSMAMGHALLLQSWVDHVRRNPQRIHSEQQ